MARIRSKANALSRLLDESSIAVCAFDRQRTIIYCNTACGELVGHDPNLLLGQQVAYRAPKDDSLGEAAVSLCPPPEAFDGQRVVQEVTLSGRSDQPVVVQGQFIALGAERSEAPGVLAAFFSVPRNRPARDTVDDVDLDAAGLHKRLAELRQTVFKDSPYLDELVGSSAVIERVRKQVGLASQARTRVVVRGPIGSGRELVARSIYRQMMPPKFGLPLVPVYCPITDAELLQTTIRALLRETGDAAGDLVPTLLLLEVDQLLPAAQSELAGFLDLPTFPLLTVATTEQSLVAKAEGGEFHAELAQRLSILEVQLPPLVDRRQDIPLLCQHFVEVFNATSPHQLSGMTQQALDELTGYEWPENVDELADVVLQAARKADGPMVGLLDLPDKIRWASDVQSHPRRKQQPIVLDKVLAGVERDLIEGALKDAKGNKTKAAQFLGITRARLHRRLEHFGIE